jgi:phenylacetic acid degradation operon negative regulatory protein
MRRWPVSDEPGAPLARPRSLILYVYGGFVRRLGGWISVAGLIRLLGDLSVEPPTVRAALLRMKRIGLLASSRRLGGGGYALTPEAWRLLDEGDRPILASRQAARLGDGWVLAVFSIPERQRDDRHRLRGRLTWLGFGTVAPGVWIAPRRQLGEVREALASLQPNGYVELFEVAAQDLPEARSLVRRAWDLDRLARLYDEFTARWEPVLETWSATVAPPDAGRAFADYVHAIADWRRLPFLDPGLPPEVLPPDWPGDRAAWVYFSLLERVDGPALEHVRARSR